MYIYFVVLVVAYCLPSGSDRTCGVWGLLPPDEIWQRWHSLSASVAWLTCPWIHPMNQSRPKAKQGVSVQSFTDCLAFGPDVLSALRPWTAFEALLQSLCEPSRLIRGWFWGPWLIWWQAGSMQEVCKLWGYFIEVPVAKRTYAWCNLSISWEWDYNY